MRREYDLANAHQVRWYQEQGSWVSRSRLDQRFQSGVRPRYLLGAACRQRWFGGALDHGVILSEMVPSCRTLCNGPGAFQCSLNRAQSL